MTKNNKIPTNRQEMLLSSKNKITWATDTDSESYLHDKIFLFVSLLLFFSKFNLLLLLLEFVTTCGIKMA